MERDCSVSIESLFFSLIQFYSANEKKELDVVVNVDVDVDVDADVAIACYRSFKSELSV